MAASQRFAQQLPHALRHLYDPRVLRRDALIAVLGLDQRANAHGILRDVLIEAIASLKPGAGVPPDSDDWRTYYVRHCRFVQLMDQDQTAEQLGMGQRQMRREQTAAVQTLAELLCTRYVSTTRAASICAGCAPRGRCACA